MFYTHAGRIGFDNRRRMFVSIQTWKSWNAPQVLFSASVSASPNDDPSFRFAGTLRFSSMASGRLSFIRVHVDFLARRIYRFIRGPERRRSGRHDGDSLGEGHGTAYPNWTVDDQRAEPKRIREVDRIPAGIPIQIEPARQPDRIFLGELPGYGIVLRLFRIRLDVGSCLQFETRRPSRGNKRRAAFLYSVVGLIQASVG